MAQNGLSDCIRLKKLVQPLVKMEGEVIKGFGRGSSEIGCPTANFNEQVVENLPADFGTGIYLGWASISSQPDKVRKAVVSIGWNPYYNNSKKSVVSNYNAQTVAKCSQFFFLSFQETHLVHEYPENFYGDWLKLLICGYIRPEQNFASLGTVKTLA